MVIGCGAISRMLYLPYLNLEASPNSRALAVDVSAKNIAEAGQYENIDFRQGSFAQYLPEAKVAIIATPPLSHYEIARQCLEAGAHVIMEKPLTATHEEAVKLIKFARDCDRLLMVNNTRRLFQSSIEIQRILATGELGGLLGIEYTEGGLFAWPTASGFYFDAKQGGRGVLSDRGSHVLDLFCWWAGRKPELGECLFDVDGGVEGFCDVRLVLPLGRARMRLSWHNKLSNRIRICCEQGEISAGIYDYREVTVTQDGKSRKRALPAEERAFEDYGITFVRRALAAAMGDSEPPVQGADVADSLALIDECYLRAERLNFPWLYQQSSKK